MYIANISLHTTVTMSSNLSLRTIRIPALRQQCRFQHRPPPQSSRAFSTTAPQAFVATSPRLRKKESNTNRLMSKAAMSKTGQTSPEVLRDQAEQEGEGEMVEDIGLLQDTIVRASWKNLPEIWKRAFWGYWWKVLKNKGTGLYS
jgi:protein MBA1